ncbi:uncharacterized protein [Notamacropus eugenii]|uniref:uncharacterized protein isoform X2 n=1 Tax=Notamacropus eugenii TaxID=9315 RepID=UPI003B67AAFF
MDYFMMEFIFKNMYFVGKMKQPDGPNFQVAENLLQSLLDPLLQRGCDSCTDMGCNLTSLRCVKKGTAVTLLCYYEQSPTGQTLDCKKVYKHMKKNTKNSRRLGPLKLNSKSLSINGNDYSMRLYSFLCCCEYFYPGNKERTLLVHLVLIGTWERKDGPRAGEREGGTMSPSFSSFRPHWLTHWSSQMESIFPVSYSPHSSLSHERLINSFHSSIFASVPVRIRPSFHLAGISEVAVTTSPSPWESQISIGEVTAKCAVSAEESTGEVTATCAVSSERLTGEVTATLAVTSEESTDDVKNNLEVSSQESTGEVTATLAVSSEQSTREVSAHFDVSSEESTGIVCFRL